MCPFHSYVVSLKCNWSFGFRQISESFFFTKLKFARNGSCWWWLLVVAGGGGWWYGGGDHGGEKISCIGGQENKKFSQKVKKLP